MTKALVPTGRSAEGEFPPPDSLLAQRAHRPFPLPSLPWVMTQSWFHLLFAHWPMPAERVRPLVPDALELETFGGDAWVALTPFRLANLRVRGLPKLGDTSEFLEMNFRTYVSRRGVPGVLFFSLDASSRTAVRGARALYRLPYFEAAMSMAAENGGWRYRSSRKEGGAEARLGYRPVAAPASPAPGSFEAWSMERYCLYAPLRSGRLLRAHIHHSPWRVAPAEGRLELNTVGDAAGIALEGIEPMFHYSEEQHILGWAPELVD